MSKNSKKQENINDNACTLILLKINTTNKK